TSQRARIRSRPQRHAEGHRRIRRVHPRAWRFDHLPLNDTAPAEQRRPGDSAGGMGGAGSAGGPGGPPTHPRWGRAPGQRGEWEVRVVSGEGAAAGRALVVGVTGISGGNLAQRLLSDGWEVVGLCRNPDDVDPRITPLTADLEDLDAVSTAIAGTAPTHVFFT